MFFLQILYCLGGWQDDFFAEVRLKDKVGSGTLRIWGRSNGGFYNEDLGGE
jgi:hypothetical protein